MKFNTTKLYTFVKKIMIHLC